MVEITEKDLEGMDEAVLVNYQDGVAMQAKVRKVVYPELEGEKSTVLVLFEIKDDEEEDNPEIYTLSRIISADVID